MRKSYKKTITKILARLEELKQAHEKANQDVENYINDSSIQDDKLFDELLQARTWARCQVFTLEFFLKYDLGEYKYFEGREGMFR
jgi:hypothetical protein